MCDASVGEYRVALAGLRRRKKSGGKRRSFPSVVAAWSYYERSACWWTVKVTWARRQEAFRICWTEGLLY
jgi:hypothetical protein